MPKKDSAKQRVLALIFIFILLGSTVAYGIIALFGPKQQIIPNERILNYKLNSMQTNLLVQNYFTVIEYNYQPSCIECIQVKNVLEEITQNSENQIYLQEIENYTQTSLYVVNIFNETMIYNPTVNQSINVVCDSLIYTPTWCAINRI
ncbi:MAG: hypothetical protein QXM68_02595 [Candidatus Aenigmatarchaeota archaeon]